MCENQDKLIAAIYEMMSSDDYEYSRALTVGGTTGLYKWRSPYNTECEYSCVQANATGNGSFLLSVNPGMNVPALNGTQSYGLASNGGESNAIDGLFVNISANIPYAPSQVFQPLPSPGDLYCSITAAANQSLFVAVMFRRKLLRIIPNDPERRSPHRPVNLRQNRRTFMAGWSAQDPISTGKPYKHEELGIQDTDMDGYRARFGELRPASSEPITGANDPRSQRRAYRKGGRHQLVEQFTKRLEDG